MMIKQLRKVGNSTALLLDKPILELLGIKDRGQVQLTVTNGSLLVTPVNPQPVSDEEFQATLDRVIKDWGPVLKRLA
jgi:antitoxin component of MazEF toxin-antitoxin module